MSLVTVLQLPGVRPAPRRAAPHSPTYPIEMFLCWQGLLPFLFDGCTPLSSFPVPASCCHLAALNSRCGILTSSIVPPGHHAQWERAGSPFGTASQASTQHLPEPNPASRPRWLSPSQSSPVPSTTPSSTRQPPPTPQHPEERISWFLPVTKSIPKASINIPGMAEKIDCLISRHRVKL